MCSNYTNGWLYVSNNNTWEYMEVLVIIWVQSEFPYELLKNMILKNLLQECRRALMNVTTQTAINMWFQFSWGTISYKGVFVNVQICQSAIRWKPGLDSPVGCVRWPLNCGRSPWKLLLVPAMSDQALLLPATDGNGTLEAPLHSCWHCAVGAVANENVRDHKMY